MVISNKIWQQAQEYEKIYHLKKSHEDSISHYRESYKSYFHYLGIDKDLKGQRIIEIGCANVPALMFCENYGRSLIIEPLPSERLEKIVKGMNVDIIKQPAEYVEVNGYDQVWIFNVLQHVINPEKLVANMKIMARKIYFFEPINTEISVNHPHSMTMEDFERWFGEVSYYPFTNTKYFHNHECAYGLYDNNSTAPMVIPPPHEYKQSVVAQAQKDFRYRTLIETGTFRGDMIQGQLTNFDLIISIEIDRRMYDDAVNRFAGNNNVMLVCGNSAMVMDGILAGIKNPCIFWLDGHYFRPEQTPAGQKQSPVLEELEAILRHPVRHVILIDDMRLFDGVHYPTIEQVKEKMSGYNCHIENDIMKLW